MPSPRPHVIGRPVRVFASNSIIASLRVQSQELQKTFLGLVDWFTCVYALGMANYTRSQFTRYGDFGVSEEWRTETTPSALLAYVDHYNGAISTAQVFDPATGHTRTYSMRTKDRAMAIVARHLERNGYKNCVQFSRLDGIHIER